MSLDITSRLCGIEPFRYQATPQPGADDGASGNQINEQALEDYLSRLKTAICDDLEAIIGQATAGVGVTSFLQLSDTPDSYAGAANQQVTVNGTGTGLVFTPIPVPEPDRPDLSTRLVGLMKPLSGTTLGAGSLSLLGSNTIVVGGSTASTQVPTGASEITNHYRYRVNSAVLAGGVASLRWSTTLVLGQSGWRWVGRWGTPTAVAQQRFFAGMTVTTGAIANVNPSTLLNQVGVAYDSADTSLSIMHNDGAGACTVVPLGASFPVDTTSFYEAELVYQRSSGEVTYRVLNVGTGIEATGSLTTNLPADTTLLTGYMWVNSGTTVASVSLDMQCHYVETSQ